MSCLGNVIWFLLGGIWMGLTWWFFGVLCFISIVGIPWGRACFVIGEFAFFPFGKMPVSRDVLTGRPDIGTGPARTAHVRVHAGVAILVVGGALLCVRKHLVGLFGLFELFFGALGGIPLIAVRVVLHRQLAISLLDFVLGSVLGNAEDLVIVSFGHG